MRRRRPSVSRPRATGRPPATGRRPASRPRSSRRAGSSISATRIAVLGAGSWGTALAVQLSRAGHPVLLWGRDPEHLATIARERCNTRYLPGVELPAPVHVQPDLEAAVRRADDVLIAVPSHAFRETLIAIRPAEPKRLAWATKGFELETGLLP